MTIIPAKHTFTIWQGATFYEVLTLYETMNQTMPRNLHPSAGDYTAAMIIRKKPNDDSSSNILLTLASSGSTYTSSPGCNITLPTDSSQQGQIILSIDANYTSINHITWKTAVYDLILTGPDGVTDALLYGGIKVNGV